MYGVKKETDVNQARLAVFSATYTPKKNSEKLIKSLFKYDPSRLPPCEAELEQQFRRTVFISQLWSGAYLRVPTDLEPREWGWILEDEQYDFHWYLGPTLPAEVNDIIIHENAAEERSGIFFDHAKIFYQWNRLQKLSSVTGPRKSLQLTIEELSENLANNEDSMESPESSDTESENEDDYDCTDTDDTDDDAE